jgi:hypothetical protein
MNICWGLQFSAQFDDCHLGNISSDNTVRSFKMSAVFDTLYVVCVLEGTAYLFINFDY